MSCKIQLIPFILIIKGQNMTLYKLEPGITLVDLAPPIGDFGEMMGSYIIQSEKTAIIDVGPATSIGNLMKALAELRIRPEDIDYVLTSHIHLDHSGGLGQAMKLMPKAIGIVHEKGLYHLAHPDKLWQASLKTLGQVAQDYGAPEPVPEERLVAAYDGKVIDLGGIQFETLITPGHAPHHISFIDRKRGKLFPGESAGVYFPKFDLARPATPPPFDLKQALVSADKMIAAEPREIYYQHFGYSSDAILRLKKFKEQAVAWARFIAQHLNETGQEMIDKLLTADDTLEKVNQMPKDHRRLERYFVTNNILGYIDYLKREGVEVLKEL
jgi:glyoxylase-like metal-dependent hydrolase (beta-lactamase superfamily II)